MSAPDVVHDICAKLAHRLQDRGWMMATAESCTGGLIGGACTDLSGSSVWFDCGFVTYSNDAKIAMLGVHAALLKEHGAVSEAVATAMALGAVAKSRARVSVAVTGVAGPTGGSKDKPVGTVWFCWNVDGALSCQCRQFEGNRAAVRAATVDHALATLLTLL